MLLDDERASDLFVRVMRLVARAAVPQDAARALGLGRVVALQKPAGRVRGIVIGVFTRRLVARPAFTNSWLARSRRRLVGVRPSPARQARGRFLAPPPSRQRSDRKSSGYARSLRRRAKASVAPAYRPPRRLGTPWRATPRWCRQQAAGDSKAAGRRRPLQAACPLKAGQAGRP